MKSITKKITGALLIAFTAIAFLTSCNKDVEQFANIPLPPVTTAKTLGDSIYAIPRDTLFYKILQKGGLLPFINNRLNNFTIYVPDSTAVKQFISAATGGAVPVTASNAVFSAFITGSFPAASAAAIGSYAIVPQAFPTTAIHADFPNFPLPTLLNPAPTLSAFLRFDVYPTTRNGNWVNNIPVVEPNIITGNGVIHHTAAVLSPPQRAVWERLNTDIELTYFKAAILRADQDPAASGALVAALNNIGANLTVFAPINAAVQPVLFGAIYQGLIASGVPPATAFAQATTAASTPAGFNLLPITTVKGIVVYHLMSKRAFANNFPTVLANFPTLLNGAIAAHPGVGLQVTLGGLGTASAIAKGVGNATASNLIINPTPDGTASYGATPPATPQTYPGKSDQNYTNGVLHKIDQTLLPQ